MLARNSTAPQGRDTRPKLSNRLRGTRLTRTTRPRRAKAPSRRRRGKRPYEPVCRACGASQELSASALVGWNAHRPIRNKGAVPRSPPMPAQPASAIAVSNRNQPIESSWPAKAGRISIGDGRYWARTSDPQLVDSGRLFAPVRPGSLNPHGYPVSASTPDGAPNLNERRALPLLPCTRQE